MIVLSSLLAVLCASLFAGASLYINVAEHPARMKLDTGAALRQWAPSYQRATMMQAPLALVSLLSGIATWLQGAPVQWLVAAVLIGLVVPFTFIVIMPTNKSLLDPRRDPGSADTRNLLIRWNRLHGVRTGLSLASCSLYLWLLCGR